MMAGICRLTFERVSRLAVDRPTTPFTKAFLSGRRTEFGGGPAAATARAVTVSCPAALGPPGGARKAAGEALLPKQPPPTPMRQTAATIAGPTHRCRRRTICVTGRSPATDDAAGRESDPERVVRSRHE